MNKKVIWLSIIGLMASSFSGYLILENTLESYVNPELPLYYMKQDGTKVYFDLVDPDEAPKEIRENVQLGFRIMNQTPLYAHPFVGDHLTCSNCHLSAGNTLGGKGGGISLVGVTSIYPAYSEREGKVIDLADRINLCFERSMNGIPIPKDSKQMKALIAYMGWISKEADKLKDKPWLGLPQIVVKQKPNADAGEKYYDMYCAMCHRRGGEGSDVIPPVWGPYSFNTGAGMNKLETLAAFIYANMPDNDPFMTREQSLDIASYILQKPRPVQEEKQQPKKN